jgi:uncharacterized linocin/CFP29 family protein
MPSGFGRSNLWDDATWQQIDTAVQGEVGQARVGQKAFQASMVPASTSADAIPARQFDATTMTINDGETYALCEISVRFSLTQRQVDNEGTLHTCQMLAQMAARAVAHAEDRLLFDGADAELDSLVKVLNRSAMRHGLLGYARQGGKPQHSEDDASIFKTIMAGIAAFIADGQPPPYALFLDASAYQSVHAIVPDSQLSPADRLPPLLQGGLYFTGALAPGSGLLASLAGNHTTIYVAQDAVTAFTHVDEVGNSHFRVFESIQYGVLESRALSPLTFALPTLDLRRAAAETVRTGNRRRNSSPVGVSEPDH